MNKKIISVLLVIFIAFILYNTLFPFHFQSVRPSSLKTFLTPAEWKLFFDQGRRTSLTDLVGNILLFLPLGFLLYVWLDQRQFLAPFFFTLFFGFTLSVGIEFLQLFISVRTSSVTDLFTNTLGTFLGALIAVVYFRVFADFLYNEVRELLYEEPITLLLIIMFLVQAIEAIFPFRVAISVSDLKNSLKETTTIPFQSKTLSFILLHRPTRFDSETFRWIKFVENFLFWSVWGYLSALCYHCYWSVQWAGRWFLLLVGFIPGLLLEFFQLFIVVRHCDINDIISSWLGVCLGMIVYGIFQYYHRLFPEDFWRRLNGAILLYVLFLLFTGLQPFDFRFLTDGPLQKMSYQMLMPFFAYFQNTNLWNIYDLIRTILYFIPISLYLSYRLLCRRYRWGSIIVFTSFLGVLFGLVIEGFQLYSATRVGDITDVLSYGLGGFLGAFLLYYFFQEILPSFQEDEDLTGEDMYIPGHIDG